MHHKLISVKCIKNNNNNLLCWLWLCECVLVPVCCFCVSMDRRGLIQIKWMKLMNAWLPWHNRLQNSVQTTITMGPLDQCQTIIGGPGNQFSRVSVNFNDCLLLWLYKGCTAASTNSLITHKHNANKITIKYNTLSVHRPRNYMPAAWNCVVARIVTSLGAWS